MTEDDPFEALSIKELLLLNYISQRRTYDTLSLLLKNLSPQDWEQLMQLHEIGQFATPLPAIAPEEDA